MYVFIILVYFDEMFLLWNEKELLLFDLMYGVSKLVCEYIGNIYFRKKGFCIKNLRFVYLYGFNEKNNYMINRFFR